MDPSRKILDLPPLKILLAEFHHLGDAVLALPFLRGALQAGHEVEVWCRPPVKPIFELVEVDSSQRQLLQLACWDPPWHEETQTNGGIFSKIRAYMELIRRWRKAKFDVAVCVWADARVQGLFAAAGIKERVGFPMNVRNYYGSHVPWRRRSLVLGWVLNKFLSICLKKPLLTKSLERAAERQHHLDAWRQIAEVLGFSLNRKVPWLRPAGVLGEELLKTINALDGRRSLFIHPGGRIACKTWPRERYEALLQELALRQPELAVLVCEAPGECAPKVAGRWQRVVRTRTVRELCAGIAACDAFLGNDSLGAHLAAAMGKPGVVIFGSSDEQIFAPGGRMEMVLKADKACPLHPCMDRCRMPSIVCLEAVEVEEVVKRIIEILAPEKMNINELKMT